jgi:hypothetical protein
MLGGAAAATIHDCVSALREIGQRSQPSPRLRSFFLCCSNRAAGPWHFRYVRNSTFRCRKKAAPQQHYRQVGPCVRWRRPPHSPSIRQPNVRGARMGDEGKAVGCCLPTALLSVPPLPICAPHQTARQVQGLLPAECPQSWRREASALLLHLITPNLPDATDYNAERQRN